MKIKQIIKLLEVIEGKLPSDMYELGSDLYERDDEKYMSISDMDFVHLIRAFKKALFEIDNDGNVAHLTTNPIIKLEARVSELLKENERLKADKEHYNCVRKDVYEMLFDKCDHLQDRLADLHKRLEKKSYTEVTAPRYVFSEIPNDCDGQRFVDDAKKYFNRSRYNMRVRGQHIKEEYKGTGATAYGQNIEQSTHLRVYIEEK